MIPAVDGNFWVREIGLFDEDGDLIALGNKSATFKPILADGEANELLLRIAIEVTSSDAVELVIDPSVVMASQDYVNERFSKKEHTHDYSTPKDLEDLEKRMGLPIGFQHISIQSAPKENELLQLGGEFSRTDFPELWTFIQTQISLLKTEEEWQLENTTNNMCGFFSKGDGNTTFRLMNLKDAFVRAVDNVDRLSGTYEEDELKSHTHASTGRWGGYGAGGSAGIHSGSSTTSATGGDETRPKNIGALPLIVAKRG